MESFTFQALLSLLKGILWMIVCILERQKKNLNKQLQDYLKNFKYKAMAYF